MKPESPQWCSVNTINSGKFTDIEVGSKFLPFATLEQEIHWQKLQFQHRIEEKARTPTWASQVERLHKKQARKILFQNVSRRIKRSIVWGALRLGITKPPNRNITSRKKSPEVAATDGFGTSAAIRRNNEIDTWWTRNRRKNWQKNLQDHERHRCYAREIVNLGDSRIKKRKQQTFVVRDCNRWHNMWEPSTGMHLASRTGFLEWPRELSKPTQDRNGSLVACRKLQVEKQSSRALLFQWPRA